MPCLAPPPNPLAYRLICPAADLTSAPRRYLQAHADTELLIELAFSLLPSVFPPQEFCPSGNLYIIQRGAVFYCGRMLREGNGIWGLDVILEDRSLQIQFPAIAAAYVWVYKVPGEELVELIRHHPATATRLKPVIMRIRTRRAVVRAAERKLYYEEGVVFRGRVRPVFAADVVAEMDRRAAQLQSDLNDEVGPGKILKVPEGFTTPTLGVTLRTPSMSDRQSANHEHVGEGTPGTSPSGRRVGRLSGRLKTREKKSEVEALKERKQSSSVLLATRNVGLRVQATRNESGGSKAGGRRGGRKGKKGAAAEGEGEAEVWTVEMAAEAEVRMNGRMSKLEDGLASVGDRLAGIEGLLRRVAAGTPNVSPEPAQNSTRMLRGGGLFELNA